MDVDVHLIRYYFHTHPNSDDIKNSIGDNGFFQNDVIINFIDPSGKDVSTDFCIEKNDLLVNIAIAALAFMLDIISEEKKCVLVKIFKGVQLLRLEV